jgi:hypothetical protein
LSSTPTTPSTISSTEVDLDRLAPEDLLGEAVVGHVRAAPRTIDGEEPQARHREAVQLGVADAHQFVGALGGGVERHRSVDRVGFLEAGAIQRAIAVDRAGRRVDQVADLVMTGSLQHRQVAGQIGVLIGERVVDRVAHARLSGQVHNALGADRPDQLGERDVVGDIHADHGEAWTILEPGGAGGLEGRVIIVVEKIDPDHRLAALQQALGHVHADEARRARNDNRSVHNLTLVRWRRR